MWLQVEEANAVVVREREAARKAIEEAPPVIKEIPVLVEDTEKINSLTSEVEALKVCVFSRIGSSVMFSLTKFVNICR